METLYQLLKAVRPRQWIKNLAVFAALMFSGMLFVPEKQMLALWTCLMFVCLSSATYLFNDLCDVKSDRMHPFKKLRPIASGKLPIPIAIFSLICLGVLGLVMAQALGLFVLLIALFYIAMQISYSSYLKRVPIVDVIVIALGYLVRVYAGALAVGAHMDVWLLLTVISASLFLAVGKRRSEMTLMANSGTQARVTLKRYTEALLDIYTAMFATATWITYSLFTFNHPRIVPDGRALTLISFLPRELVSEKWLMITIPFVVYGLMRYLQIIYEKNEGESPEKVLMSDRPLLFVIVAWVLMTVGVLYYVG